MKSLWCTRKGISHGFHIELVACVACTCKKRKTCKPYADLPLTAIASANKESKRTGHGVAEDLPLFESAIKD